MHVTIDLPLAVLDIHRQARSQDFQKGGYILVVGPYGRGGWVREEGFPLPREARKLRKYTVFESLRMAQMMTSQLSHG